MTTPATHNASSTRDAHVAAYPALAPALPGAGTGWIDELRRDAIDRFAEAGLPDRRLEAWKFTGLANLEKHAFTPGQAATATVARLPAIVAPENCAARLVFIDGRLAHEESQFPHPGAGVTITTLAAALNENPKLLEGKISTTKDAAGALWDLNAAFMADGAVIRLDEGTKVDAPIALCFVATGGKVDTAHLRNLIILGERAQAQIIETYVDSGDSEAPCFTNTVSDAALGKGATLTHVRIQAQGAETIHTGRAVVDIAAGAEYNSFALALGGRISRQETDAAFSGPGGKARLYGAYLGRARQHIDHTTRIDHAHPDCVTEESFRGVLDGRAHGVFQGLIRVAPHAVGTDARQKNQALLLSDHAVADTKPELEILADDVKCAHGATVGDIDTDALFYMMSRGIPETAARGLLIAGFIGELIDGFGDAGMAGHLHEWVAHWQGDDGEGSDD
jgi:Fe-S cluster assembly protein SufD